MVYFSVKQLICGEKSCKDTVEGEQTAQLKTVQTPYSSRDQKEQIV